MAISVGAAAPDFTLKDQSQKEVKLSEFQGKKNVVIVFYPLDWSPVCTNEHICLVNDMKRFEDLDAQVLGVSVDSAWSHKAFAEKMGIKYPLLADFQPRGAVGEKYGVFLADKGITGRAIAIVDRSGKIAWFKNYDIPTLPDVKEVSDALAKFKNKHQPPRTSGRRLLPFRRSVCLWNRSICGRRRAAGSFLRQRANVVHQFPPLLLREFVLKAGHRAPSV